jgi:PAS domain-containing protein
VFDTIREGCVILGADGRIVEFNPAAVRLLPELRGQMPPPEWHRAGGPAMRPISRRPV